MDNLSTSEKEEKIANDTYTISFWSKTEDNKNLQEGKDTNGAWFCEKRTEQQWNKTLVDMAKNMKDKTIIKICIAGEAAYQQKYIKDLPLSKELFSKILDCIDFNRQILIVENTTCFSAGHLMPSDKLLQKDGKYSRYDPSPIDDDDKIVNLCKKKLQNDRQCFYYGAVEPTFAFVDEICFIQKHSSSIDGERIVLRPKGTVLITKANEKYINCLYNDMLSLDTNKTFQPNNDINNNSPMANNHCNIPTYQGGMGNNVLGNNQYPMPFSKNFPPPPPQFSQIPYGSSNVLPNYNNGFPPNCMPPANNYLFPQQPQFVSQVQQYQPMPYCNNNIPFNKANNYTNPVLPQSQLYQQNTYINNNINNNTTNTNNHNVDVPTCQTMQQRNIINNNPYGINNKNINSTFQDNSTEKNNENVFCDLKSGICCGRKCW